MNHINKSIEEIEEQIQQKQKELEGLQITVNNLCKYIGIEPKYVIESQIATITHRTLKGDEYFRRPTATVITMILENRKKQDLGPASIDEIYKKMLEGGYVFKVKEPNKAIGTALGKNQKFTKVGEKWGLSEWYPSAKEERQQEEIKEENGTVETPKKRGRPPKKSQTQETINEEHQNQTEGTNKNENK